MIRSLREEQQNLRGHSRKTLSRKRVPIHRAKKTVVASVLHTAPLGVAGTNTMQHKTTEERRIKHSQPCKPVELHRSGHGAQQKSSDRDQNMRRLARTLVNTALQSHFYYPLLARKQGWQGQVRLGFRIINHGQMTHMHIAQSSGYGILDHAALSTLLAVAKLNPLPSQPRLDGLDIVIPVEYRLIDG